MMKKAWIKVLIVGIAGVTLTGCGNAIPKMTEQQQELIVEFAAGELLKFDQNHVTKLTTLELDQEAESMETDADRPGEQNENQSVDAVDNTEAQKEGVSPDEVTVIDQTQEAPASVEEFLNLDEIKITYTGYETVDSYPEGGEDDLFFFMSATANSKLLVLKFQAENLSAGEKVLNLAQNQVRYKIVVDGVEQNAQTTMLPNNMVYYQGTLAPQESTELVLIGEVAAGSADQITSLELTMKAGDETAVIALN